MSAELYENEEVVIPSKDATELVADCYTDLSKYVIKTRAYPSVVDGMKAVYRRTVYAARVYNNKVKSVAIIGDTTKLHPHGDDSVRGVLNIMACKYEWFPLFDGKGNFGGLGGDAANPRYTEACLSEVARLMYLELIDYAEMIDGEAGFPEPKYLPALIPYSLLQGSSGMTVGMPTPNIMPLNAIEVIDYWIARLEGREPKIPMPDLGEIILNCSRDETIEPVINTGVGKIWYRPMIIQESDNRFTLSESTPGCYIGDLPGKLSYYIDNDIVDYNDESDYNGYRHVYEVNENKMNPQAFKEVIDKKMRCAVSYRFVFEEDEKAVFCGIDYIYKKNVKYLIECTIRKYTDKLAKAKDRSVVLRAIRDFKNAGYVKKLEKLSEEDVIKLVEELGYESWVGKSVLGSSVRYLTKSHDAELEEIDRNIELYQSYLDDPKSYLLTLYYRLRELVMPFYNSRGHSVLRDEITDTKKYAHLDVENNKLIIDDNPENGISWNRNLLLVSDKGRISRRYVSSKVNAEILLDTDNEKWVQLVTDDCNYVVLVSGRYLTVKKISDISSDKEYVKLWDDSVITKTYGSKSDKLRVIDSRNKTDDLNLENWIKSRVSYPSKCMRNEIVDFKEL